MFKVRSMTRALVAGVLVAGVFAGPVQAAGDEAVMKYRQALMKGQSGHLGAMFQIVKGGAGKRADLAFHAKSLEALSAMSGDAFSQQTSGGKTRAKDEIWSDAAAFSKVVTDMEEAAAGVVAAVTSGDDAAIGKALGAAGEGCKGCHKKFRTKK